MRDNVMHASTTQVMRGPRGARACSLTASALALPNWASAPCASSTLGVP